MRILNQDNGAAVSSVCLYLTPDEAETLLSSLERLVGNPKNHHVHVDDDAYRHEITITIYRDDNLESFSERSRQLILNDE